MRNFLIVGLIIVFYFCSTGRKPMSLIIDESTALALQQYKWLDKAVADSMFPFSEKPDGSVRASASSWWTSGFFPGTLWYLYMHSADQEIKSIAQKRLKALEKEKYNDGDHDIGFKILCSFGNAWNATKDSSYYNVILTAAQTATHRFNSNLGLIRSWGDKDDTNQFLVIVDNMMNLELLFWATRHTGDSSYYRIAQAHADNTMKNHYRADGSSYHVLNYDQQNGQIVEKKTHQGSADESSWARGNAWGFYGFVMVCRETGETKYLQHAQKIARFFIDHPHMPRDGIPYWDFDAPDIPNALRDASAAAIMASAMLELSTLVSDTHNRNEYLNFAENILRTLSSSAYRTKWAENNNYLIKHGIGHMPNKTEIDVPLCYADYYYVEALLRFKDILKNFK